MPVARFTTTSLERLGGTKYCGASQGPVGDIWRTTEAPVPGDKESKKIGQYYYDFDGPGSPCTANQAASQLETEQINDLQEAFGTIQETN